MLYICELTASLKSLPVCAQLLALKMNNFYLTKGANYTSKICLTKMFVGKNLSYVGGGRGGDGGWEVQFR